MSRATLGKHLERCLAEAELGCHASTRCAEVHPLAPLSGASIVSKQNARTLFEPDGMLRANLIIQKSRVPDPTLYGRALASIAAQTSRRNSREPKLQPEARC